MFRRRVIAVTAALLCTAGLFAQSRTDEYGYQDTDDLAPEVQTDTALFLNAVKLAGDLYAQVAGYRLSFVENRRRNTVYNRNEALYAGVRLPFTYKQTLRSLGADRLYQTGAEAIAAGGTGGVGTELYSFGAAEEAAGTIGAAFATRGYSAGINVSAETAFGSGWSMAAAINARTGRDLHVDGVFLNSAGIALRFAKRFTGGGEFSLLAAAEPSERGLRTASTAEAFALTGNNLYNPSWGWQNGQQRNSRVRREFIPLAVAALAVPLGGSTTLDATLAARAGTRRKSSLGWYDAATPMPDNYRYLPSYMTGASAEAVAEAWLSGDERYTQINWNELYEQNRMSDHGAVYALDDRVRRITDLQAAIGARTTLGSGVAISYGAAAQYEVGRDYRQMRDLMGGSFIVDIDYYLVDDDSFSNSLQNDMRNPDRMIRTGDRFGYDYALVRQSAALHASVEYVSGRFDLRAVGRIGSEIICRHGYYEKELFAGNGSFGDSEKMRFATYSAAAELGWTPSPRHRIRLSLNASAEAPEAEHLFLNPQYNNRTVGVVDAVRRLGAEINGRVAGEAVQLQLTLFAESQRGGIETMQYYDDLAAEFCDMTVSGIDILTYGAEAAATVRFGRRWYLDAAATALRCRYTADPTVRVWSDRSNAVIDAGSPSSMGSCVPGGVPQLAASLTVGYRSFSGWSFAISGAWTGVRCVDPSFLRRTERVAYQGASSPEAFGAIVTQERLPDALDIGMRLSKRWFVGRSSRITASVTVNNLFGDRNNIYSAYESHRVRRISRGIQSDYIPLPTRYLYAYPRTIMLTAAYAF